MATQAKQPISRTSGLTTLLVVAPTSLLMLAVVLLIAWQTVSPALQLALLALTQG